jgi:hypothetical protein
MPDLVNAKEYGKLHGVSHEAVRKWIESGKLGPIGDAVVKGGKAWAIDVQKADAYYNDLARETNQSRLFDPAPGGDPQPGAPAEPPKKSAHEFNLNTYKGATAWRQKYEALRSQHEYEVESGKYVLVEEVRAAAFNKARLVRDTLLTIPDRIGAILAAETDEAKVRQILGTEIKMALEELTK